MRMLREWQNRKTKRVDSWFSAHVVRAAYAASAFFKILIFASCSVSNRFGSVA